LDNNKEKLNELEEKLKSSQKENEQLKKNNSSNNDEM
jgi:hypothetical protein